MELLNQIKKLIEKKNRIQFDENSLDDDKEIEHYEFEIINLIYKYCLSKKYSYMGFPERYQDYIDQEDEDFYDFLSFDVKYLTSSNL